jgi:lipase
MWSNELMRTHDTVQSGLPHAERSPRFLDPRSFYNGPGSFARWPPARREAFLAVQQARGDLWDVLFGDLLTLDALARVTAPVHVVEGSHRSAVDHTICNVVRRHVPHAQHTLIESAGHMMPLTHPEPLTRALLTEIER